MSDQTTPEEQPQDTADAGIALWMEGSELKVNVQPGMENTISNEAVHFAHWIGRNLRSLVPLARADLDNQTRIHNQARTIAEMVGTAPTGPVVKGPPLPRLLGPDGETLQ